MEEQPASKKARLAITDFFVKADCPTDEGNEQSAFVNLLPTTKSKEDLRPEPEETSEASSLSTNATQNAHDYPFCWNDEQCSYFSKAYSWLFFENGKVGCALCKSIKNLGVHSDKSIHLANEWTECKVKVAGGRSVAQKSLRKKIAKHDKSKAHNEVVRILNAKEQKSLETATLKGQEKHKAVTERCLRTAYFIAYQNRPLSDYPDLIDLQERNGVILGTTLQSRFSCKEMISCIAQSMRTKICEEIRKEGKKIAIITDESTTISKKACVIIYIRSVVRDKPINIFLDICELAGLDAQSICNCIIHVLARYSFDKEYLVKNLIAFTSDGASVMLGTKNGVGKRLKEQFPALFIWNCMNHRLELAVADAIKEIDAFHALESLFNKIYSLYSLSSKLQRELKEIASKLDVELKKIGKVFTIRWAASTYRAVNALWSSFQALHEHFNTLSNDRSIRSCKRKMYSGIAKRLATKEFVEDVAVIKDCLGQISILSESLQKSDVSVIDANRYLQYTINSLEKIKRSVTEGKYSFDEVARNDVAFKGVPLHSYESRASFPSFNKPQFLQALIDNIKARLLNASNENALKQLEVFAPERWSSEISAPWFEGEKLLVELRQRFSIACNEQELVMAFRDYVSDPRKTPNPIEDMMQEILHTIPVSSSEAERGFSQMNLVCTPTRSTLAITTLSSLLFIGINGPPPKLWNAQESLSRWLVSHRSAMAPERKRRNVKTKEDLNAVELMFT